MRIQKNYTSPTFKSNEGLKKIAKETLVEFHQEFPKLKSPTKLWEDAQNAGCETKHKLFKELAIIWDEKYGIMESEYLKFKSDKNPSYEEKMEKIKELTKRHRVSNCGLMNRYYQYMLAKKGIYSECSRLEVFEHKHDFLNAEPIKNHLSLNIKESEKAINSFVADSWLDFVEGQHEDFKTHINQYMHINDKEQCVTEERFLMQGYQNFLSNIKSKNKAIQ